MIREYLEAMCTYYLTLGMGIYIGWWIRSRIDKE